MRRVQSDSNLLTQQKRCVDSLRACSQGNNPGLFPVLTPPARSYLAVDARCIAYWRAEGLESANLYITDLLDLLLGCNSQRVEIIITPQCRELGILNDNFSVACQQFFPELPVIDLSGSVAPGARFQHYLCADAETATWTGASAECVTVMDTPVGTLDPVHQKVLLDPKVNNFVLALDIDDTFLFLGQSICKKTIILNPYLLQFIQELLNLGRSFSVCFITARYDVEASLKILHKATDEQGISDRAALRAACSSLFSVSNIEQAFTRVLPNLRFLGTHYSSSYRLNAVGERYCAREMKGDMLLQLYSQGHVVFVDNAWEEIEYVQQNQLPERLVPILCADQPALTDNALNLLLQLLSKDEDPYAAVSYSSSPSPSPTN